MIKHVIFTTILFVNLSRIISTQSFYRMCGAKLGAPAASSSTQPKDAKRRDQTDVQMVQNVLLIWLDSNIDKNNSDCQNTIAHLRRVVNAVNIFTDGDECTQFLQDMGNEKACMIISGALGQHMMPRVHDLSQTDSIFIFCGNKIYHEEWAKKWPKIRGIFSEIKPICNALKEAAEQCEQNAVPISIMGASDIVLNKSLDQLDSSFIYTQIMKEILLSIHFEQQHIEEFIQHCRQALDGNPGQLEYLDQLAKAYREQTPIWWYTLECFLYSMLNRALRTMDADLMVKLGFFISDLHRQIQELHQEQCGNDSFKQKFIVYRGQGMEKKEFEKMVANKGGLISFNFFLSTSTARQISLGFANRALSNPQLVGVLFAMTVDPALPDTPFASVAKVGVYGAKENEVLFSMNTVFRIGQIRALNGNPRLFQVELSMTSEKDDDLRQLVDRIREETFPEDDGWHRLGCVLWKMGEYTKAKQVFEVLLEKTTEESARGEIYNRLGLVAAGLGQYQGAIEYYEKSLRIEEKQNPSDHQVLATSYNNMGSVYDSMGDYPKALSSHLKALAIQQQSLPSTDFRMGMSYGYMGSMYSRMGAYSEALSCHEEALAIFQESLPPTHPDLATPYNNIGSVYDRMGDYPKALSSHEKALAIQQQSLPPTHPDLAMSYSNIGSVYDRMRDYPKALSSFETALEIRQQSLPPTHPDLVHSYNNIGSVYDRMRDYPKALSSYEKALAIRQQSLPPTHPDLAHSYNNTGSMYGRMDDYSKALSSHEKALIIRQQSLPPTHPDLMESYTNLGRAHVKMNNYSTAHSFFERALDIAQCSLPPDDPNVRKCRKRLTRMKK